MPSTPSATPTPITPPRVPLIDERTGLIDRAWYMFFLSLFRSSVTQEDAAKVPDVGSALASYDAALTTLSQNVNTLPFAIDYGPELNSIKNAAAVSPASETATLAQQLNVLRQEVQTARQPALGSMAQLQQDNVPWLTFDTTPQAVSTAPGTVYWTDDDATLNLVLEGNTEYQFGQQLDFHPKNTSGLQIDKGMAVMATGVVGSSTKITCARAVADGSVLAQYMLGIATQDIPNNSFGYVAWFGSVRGFNTTGANKTVPEVWADGDILYFDPVYPGELTKVEPSAPALDLPIAIVTNAANNGAIFVRMKTGETLDELHDVQFTLPLANRDLLQYDSTAGYWKNITHFFLDATNKRMGINVPLPSTTLVINANTLTTPPTPLTGTVFDSHGANSQPNRFAVNAYNNAPSVTFVRANNTMAAPSGIVSGDALGLMVGTGYNSAAYTTGRVSMLFFAAENWTTTANGTDIRFTTTPLGSAVAEERFRFGPAGQFGVVVTGVVDYGSADQVLASGGASAPPYWRTLQGIPALNIITTTTHTGSSGNHYVLTNVATSTLTLPASPAAGDLVWVTTGNSLTTNVVDRNGNNIEGAATNLTLTATQQYVQLRYVNATLGWMRV